MKNVDIQDLLGEWPFEPDKNIRIVRFESGRSILQVRLPVGLEQYEMDGRPDGVRPNGVDSYFDFFRRRIDEARVKGEKAGSTLSHEECEQLFEESTLYYLRYIRFLEIEEWDKALRDTARNLRLFNFVRLNAEKKEDRLYLEQWRPFLLRVHALAAAMSHVTHGRHARALEVVRKTILSIEALPAFQGEEARQEVQEALDELKHLLARIRDQSPATPADGLREELEKAVTAEEYERAAELRDRIKALEKPAARKKKASSS